MISTWKPELMKRASELFARGNKAPTVDDAQKVIDDLHRKIGQLQVERNFLAGQPARAAVEFINPTPTCIKDEEGPP
jgi:transposase